MADIRPVGVMDSGMGGLSVLRTLNRVLPGERFVYLGDNRHAPYGIRPQEEILRLTWDVVRRLMERDVKALVIACNTATSAAAADLREKLSIPVLGLEPALKPAAEYAGEGTVAVLATEMTLRLEKYQNLLSRFGHRTVNIPCPELVEYVEAGELDSPRVESFIREKLAPLGEPLRAVVLGCTHYVWLRPVVERVVAPVVRVFDGNEGIARHLRTVLTQRGILGQEEGGNWEVMTTSDDPAVLQRMLEMMRNG